MPIRTAVTAAISAAAIISCSVAAANASASASGGPVSPVACASLTQSVTGHNATQAIHAVAANMAHTCGFTVSGSFEGVGFGIDGWGLAATSSYAAEGGLHLVWNAQGVINDLYRSGGHEYLRLYEEAGSGMSAGQTTVTLRATWKAYGVTSNSVIKAAGSTKWIKLTAAQQKTVNSELGLPLTSAALGADIAKGSGRPWRLGGTKTVDGVRCVVLTDPVNNSGPDYLGENLYVNAATGLPVRIQYVSQDGQPVASIFGNWGRVITITPPPASKVVNG
jgi:hypothetical protein